jgi:hypothetical protein
MHAVLYAREILLDRSQTEMKEAKTKGLAKLH